jgi:DHA1 family bicyclomycin/chloramphenicol resistance-like MFS transporter
VHLYLTKVKASDLTSVFKLKPILKNYVKTLQNRKFLFYHLAGSFAMGIMFAYISSIAYILLTLYKVSQEQFSLLFALNALGFIMGGQANRYFLRKYSVLQISYVAGSFTLMFSILFFAFAATTTLSLTVFSVFLVAILFCTGLVNPNATAMSLGSVETNIGLASALNGSSRMIIGATVSVGIGFIDSTSLVPMTLFFIGLSITTLLFLRFGSIAKT